MCMCMCVCVVFVYVWGREVWMCRYGCFCVGRGNIGLCLCREGEGHMCVCGCWMNVEVECMGDMSMYGRNIYVNLRYICVGFVCECAGYGSLCRAYIWT